MLSEQDLTTIDGRREVLAGKLLERPETSEEQVEQEIAEFETACTDEAARLRPGPAA
jgi:hypothetical protein